MPFFDFECKKCKHIENRMVKWSETMHEDLDECPECGKKDWRRTFTVTKGKNRDMTTEQREVADLSMGKGWH
jgi:putative FmdB family regulatory protein